MSDDPTINSLLQDQIATLDRNLNRRLDQQDRALVEIKHQTTATNGRVTALEKARERAQGVMFAYSWLPLAVVAVLTAGLELLVMALSGNLH